MMQRFASIRKLLNSNTSKDYFWTFLVEFFVLVAGLLIFRLAADHYGEAGLNDFSFYRRIFSFVQPVLTFGMVVAVIRYVAQSQDHQQQFSYLISSVLSISLLSAVFFLLMNASPQLWAKLFFSDPEYAIYIFPLSVSIPGILLHLMVYSYLRGKLYYQPSNVLQLINLVITPVLAFYLTDALSSVLLWNGLIWLGSSLLAFLLVCIKERTAYRLQNLIRDQKVLFSFGLPRVPGDIAFGALFAIPVILIAKELGTTQAGSLAFALSLLNVVGAGLNPLTLMLLPSASKDLAEKNHAALNKQINVVIVSVGLLLILGVCTFELIAPWLLHWYLGEAATEVIYECRLIMPAAFFYGLFISLRSILDAYYEKAINSLNLIISLAVLLIGYWLWQSMDSSLEGFIVVFYGSMLSLSLLTLWRIKSIKKQLKSTLP